MSESMRDLTRELLTCAAEAEDYTAAGEWAMVDVVARKLMKHAGALLARAKVLGELAADGYHVAAVDQAVARSERPLRIPGEMPLPFAEGVKRAAAEAKPSAKGKPRAARKLRPVN